MDTRVFGLTGRRVALVGQGTGGAQTPRRPVRTVATRAPPPGGLLIDPVRMPGATRTIVVMPAYNAGRTLERVYADVPKAIVDEVIVVDDRSPDDTAAVARRLPVTLIEHERNTGYGGNQKTCYRAALERGADFVIMVHGDYQYDARMIGACVEVLRLGICDVLLGNRIRTRGEALAGGMPRVKYLANRGLTFLENLLSGQNLGAWHRGFRAYTRHVLEPVTVQANHDDWVSDTQFLVQAIHFGFRVGDVPVPVRYFDEASSISIRDSADYALRSLATFVEWYAHRFGIRTSPRFVGAPRAALAR